MSKSKEEVEAVNEKLAELTPEEIAQVNGGGAGNNGCTGSAPFSARCSGCDFYISGNICVLSGKYGSK